MSIAALVFAILGLLGALGLGWATFGLSSFFALVGLILAIVAKKKDPNDKMAKIAFVIAIIGIILGVVTGIACGALLGGAACAAAESYAAFLAL